MNINALVDKVKIGRSKYETYLEEYNKNDTLITNKSREIIDLKLKESKLTNLLDACKLILERITYASKIKLESFLTYALQSIFTDRNYSVKLDIREDTKKPSINILLVENEVEQVITDSVGGGIITTLGFLMQIYYLEVYDKNRVMFIDEGLKEVSKGDSLNTNVDYLRNLLEFLKYLSKEKHYKFIIITHDEGVKELADNIYNVKLGKVSKVEKI